MKDHVFTGLFDEKGKPVKHGDVVIVLPANVVMQVFWYEKAASFRLKLPEAYHGGRYTLAGKKFIVLENKKVLLPSDLRVRGL